MKVCTKCKVEKEFSEFSICKKVKSGLKSRCKKCLREENKEYNLNNQNKSKQYRLNNKEHIREKGKKYYSENKELINKKSKEYGLKNKDKIKEKNRVRYLKNKDKVAAKGKIYRLKNADKIKISKNKYYVENKDNINVKGKEYKLNNKESRNKRERERREAEPLHKLKCNIRGLIGFSMRKNGYSKKSRTYEILGCSYEDFKIHLENQFTEGMTWNNVGKWHLDHIYPVSRAIDEEHLIKLNHYTNFQPLWAEDNLKKGNKY